MDFPREKEAAMRLELKQVWANPGRPVLFSGEEDLGTIRWYDETLYLEGPVETSGSAFYQDDHIYLFLHVRGAIHRNCSRCLTDILEHFDKDEFLEVPIDEVPPGMQYLELKPYIENGVRLAIERKPLCKPDCKGICPHCGANLNVEGHKPGCQALEKEVDPRWAKLKELLTSQ